MDGKLVLLSDHSIEMVGTQETIPGVALVNAWLDESGKPAWSHAGQTNVDWDRQATSLDAGETLYVSEDGDAYRQSLVGLLLDDGRVFPLGPT